MRRYSEAIKADVRRRMSPPNRQSVARISEQTGIHVATLFVWHKGWRRKRLDIAEILSLERDFDVYRRFRRQSFRRIPLP
jgi:transposase-like protein